MNLKEHFPASDCQFMDIINFSCIFLYMNKNKFRAFKALGAENSRKIDSQPKFTGSFKKESVSLRQK